LSKVGSLTAFAAEAAIWLAGAAIVAGAAGAHWDTPSVDLNKLWPGASPSLVKDFTTKISAGDFQASGSAAGTVFVTINGQKIAGTYSGAFKFKGNDSSSTMTMTMAGTKTTNDSVSVGDSDYSRTNDGVWTKTARSPTNLSFQILTAGGVTDKGVEFHNGQNLHHLDLVKAPDPKTLFNDPTMATGTYTLVLWAKDDGTPAGMTIAGTYSQDVNGSLAQATLSLDFNFEALSGVTIEAPPV
jgi:hypothetical protein